MNWGVSLSKSAHLRQVKSQKSSEAKIHERAPASENGQATLDSGKSAIGNQKSEKQPMIRKSWAAYFINICLF